MREGDARIWGRERVIYKVGKEDGGAWKRLWERCYEERWRVVGPFMRENKDEI